MSGMGANPSMPAAPAVIPPSPKDTAPAAQMAAADERRRITTTHGRQHSILQYQPQNPTILKTELSGVK